MTGQTSEQKALYELQKAALAEKNFEHSLELLDEILAIEPHAIEARLSKAHLQALNGKIGLSQYQDTITEVMARLYRAPSLSHAEGRQLLRGIQYSSSGAIRIQFFEALLESAKHAVQGAARRRSDSLFLQANIYLALHDYENFVATVEELSRSKRAANKLAALERIAKKCKSPKFPDFDAPKIFGIGLSRTATTSLNQALKQLGYDSVHWLNPNTQTVISNEDFLLFDGFTDIPVSFQFEALYQSFPNSKFIYTSRPKEPWIRSVSSHYQNTRGVSSPTQLSQPNIAQRFDGAAEPAEFNLYTRHKTWSAAYDHFSGRVNHFFFAKNSGRFLELEITEGEGWDKLCTFLGKEMPQTPFPNVNQGRNQPKSVKTSI